ncbi:MAG: hypothetical protein ACM3JJ_01990, partial [Hyphomicrobiales bacterium]
HPPNAVAFLRRVGATPAAVPDEELERADAVVHVASADPAIVATFCAEAAKLLGPALQPPRLRGVVRPTSFTGNAMQEFAYAHQLAQQPGSVAPNGYLIPWRKTSEWWAKHWMERHTYFLPRYDDAGRMVNEGHALAAEAGIRCVTRRTYRSESHPAPEGAYDFVNYFECADADVPTFQAVCAALRDERKNPEWRFVCEGPTWHGRRVATWSALFD